MHFNLRQHLLNKGIEYRLLWLAGIACLLWSISSLAFSTTQPTIVWAREAQQQIKRLSLTADFQQGKQLSHQNRAAVHLKGQHWAQTQKSPHVPKVKVDNVKAHKNAIDINQLLNAYNAMPSGEAILKKHPHDLLIFISFSMPKTSLRLWMQQARQAGGVLVIRGLVDASFKKTAHAVKDLLGASAGGVEINPVLFHQFDIKQVPAVVVTPKEMTPCLHRQSCPNQAPAYDVVYGNVSLQHALTEIEQKGSVSQQKATLILTHMRARA